MPPTIYAENVIQTYTGRLYNPWNPKPEQISLIDIAHGLSQICRFCGQSKHLWSVAQHSLLVLTILDDQGYDEEVQLAGLLHDAPEAYLNDLNPIIKADLPRYRQLETLAIHTIYRGLGMLPLFADHKDVVKAADLVALATERRDMMGHPHIIWSDIQNIRPLPQKLRCIDPPEAKHRFLVIADELIKAVRENG